MNISRAILVSTALFSLLTGNLRGQIMKLTFSSDRTGRQQIWKTAVGRSGSMGAPTQITAMGAGAQQSDEPNWSVNGKLCYQFGSSGVRGIHMIDANAAPPGSGDVRLTFSPSDERDCSWSQDGMFIAYARLSGSDYDIWIHDVAHNTEYPLLVRPANLDLSPAWSPDGESIAFVTMVGGHAEIAVQGVRLNAGIVQIDPGTFNILTNSVLSGFTNFNPTWSPDSKQIAFSTTKNGNRDIYIMSATSGDSGPLIQWTNSTADETYPAWAPGSRSIAFVSNRTGIQQIYILNQPESGAVTPTLLSDGSANDTSPAWEPLLINLDPGHGRFTSSSGTIMWQGASGPMGEHEDDLVLDIACNARVAQRFRTLITRDPAPTCTQQLFSIGQTHGSPQNLYPRVYLANHHKVSLFVSLHLNAGAATANGSSVLYCASTPRGLESFDLATEIQQQIVLLGLTDRGLTTICSPGDRGRYLVTKTKMPAVIVESAFVTNSVLAPGKTMTDEQLVDDPMFRSILSNSIMKGVSAHLGK